ncbi:hypothetical protein EJ04DRAFT_459524 [Polyplosphaeria fusca]|uniref:Uncharacterized protein n=1 Tax=Polyplosphaeria fusca TaxID=682080 RepID=A0A9P4R4A6_9PLEO|nr:hypothetical protein EJ04DRAFT_459524 [Polyplosphaeria fusca]
MTFRAAMHNDPSPAHLTSAPIFDHVVYQCEGLGLPPGQHEDVLDEQLAVAARACGIDDPDSYLYPDARTMSTAFSTLTFDSERASSMSIHSRETQSTGITSDPSRTSKDNPYVEQPSSVPRPPLHSTGLPSSDYDSVMARFRPHIGHRHSSSNSSYTNSLLSATSSLSKPVAKKRSAGLFSMFRRDSSACSSRSHPDRHGKPLTSKLECGHTLSHYAVRVHIEEALEGRENYVPPACCGKPLPRSVLEIVLTPEETDVVMGEASPSPAYTLHLDSGFGEQAISPISLSQSPEPASPQEASFVTAPISRDVSPGEQEKLNQALTSGTFTALKTQQKEQMQRVLRFESNQRRALIAYYEWLHKWLATDFETAKDKMTKRHVLELEKLDESQIVAEHEMRRAHAQEGQNVATALKYMEAYCSGSCPIDPDITHVVTEEDRKKLARQHLTQDKLLPQKHESAINVLRARQEKDLKLKMQKQQAELQQHNARLEEMKEEENIRLMNDSSRLESVVEARRRRIKNRWDLKFEIWRRDWETQHKTVLYGQLPREYWPVSPSHEGSIDPSSSLALYTKVVVSLGMIP